MDEDWAATANAPSFSLFEKITPHDAAQKELIDPFTYNRWSKAERRQYRKLRIAKIDQMLSSEKSTVESLTNALNDLSLFKGDHDNVAVPQTDDKFSTAVKDIGLDELISRVEVMKLSKDQNRRASRK